MTTNAEALAATLEGLPKALDCCAAAEELRRLSAVEAQRDALKAALKDARKMVEDWGSSAQDLFDLLPQDLARIDEALKDHP